MKTVFANTSHPPAPVYINGVAGGITPDGMISMHLFCLSPMSPSMVEHEGVGPNATHNETRQSELQGVIQSNSILRPETAQQLIGMLTQILARMSGQG